MTSVRVPSRSVAGREYTVTVGVDGRLFCNCPASLHNLECWHVKAVREEMEENDMTETALVPVRVQPPAATLPTEREISLIQQAAAMAYAGAIALPKELNSKEKVAAVMLYGHELGLKPMSAIRHLFIVNGRVQPSAEVMAGMFLSREPDGRLIVKSISNTECTMRIVRPSKNVDETYTVTWEDLKRAKLDKDVALLYPQDRLRWHCTKRILRIYASDVINAMEGFEAGGPQFAVEAPEIDEAELWNEGDSAIEGSYTAVQEPEPEPVTDETRGALAAAFTKLHDAYKAQGLDIKAKRAEWEPKYDKIFLPTMNRFSAATEAEGQELLALFAEAMPECQHEARFDEDKALTVCGKCGIALEGPPVSEQVPPESEGVPPAQQGLGV